MPIKGSLNDMSISDILQMLSIGTKTGELAITNEENLVYIYLNSGNLSSIHWMNREDKLGKILVDNEIIDKGTLNEVLNLQREENKPIGQILLELDLIDRNVLVKYLKKQIRDAILELSDWDSGYFVFDAKNYNEIAGIPISIKIEDVLLESAALQDELKASSLPHRDSILIKVKGIGKYEELTEDEKKVLEKADGETTISSIITSLPIDEFKLLKILSKLLREGYVKEAEMDSEEIVKEKTKLNEHRNLGVAFLKIDMYREALREFNRILEIEPENREALFYKGVILLITGKYSKAWGVLNSIPERENNITILNNMSVLLDIRGRDKEALDSINKALELDNKNKTVILNKIIISIKNNNLKEAEEMLNDIDTESQYRYFYSSYINASKGELNKALEELENGLKTEPDFGEYYYNLGKFYETIEKYKEAADIYKQGLKKDNNSTILVKALIDYYYKNKMFDLCEKRIDNAISSGIEDWDIYFKKGNIYFQKGRKEEAIQSWEKALELNPDNKTIKRTLELAGGDENKRGF